jgi:protein-S-isoprenylcysteine O-methyltransferase Ste14
MEKKRKVLPAVYLFMTLLAMWPMHVFLPTYQYVHEPVAYAGIAPVFLGIAIAAVSAGLFKKAGTGLLPFDEATTLVTTGFYRYSRNPMYLGMFLILAGSAFLMGSIGAALPVVIFIVIIRNNFVLGEERFLEASFGQRYLDYKSMVRRWL